MAFHGHPQGGPPMRHIPPGLVHPSGYPPHPSFGHPPPMMMMPHMGQHVPPGMMPPHGMPLPTPPRMPPHMMMVPPGPPMGPIPIIGSEPIVKIPVPSSMANMKVATTVFVGNISEKASDTLIRQILLRCGPIEGWKRVQDATGKLQGFGFCEYADPESTLRALRLLHDLKLGEKSLVAKVDAKTRKDLLKYLITRKHSKTGTAVKEHEVEKEVAKLEEDKDVATAALISEVPEQAKSEDSRVQDAIDNLLKDYRSILSNTKSNEEIQRERDVKESILFMAKQSGNIDPNSTLEDMDMEDDMKTLVSDEIKRFRESYKRSDEVRKEKKPGRSSEEGERGRSRLKESESSAASSPPPSSKGKREGSKSPTTTRAKSPTINRSSSPRRRPRSPIRSRSQERQEKEKRREASRLKEREDTVREEEEHEERIRQRRIRDRDKAYRMRLLNWEGRERRKDKECEKELKREKERREDMERERKHLGDFLVEYDDNKDDQKYYRGSAYSRRRREREAEIDGDRRDRIREEDELEELRLQVIERQAQEMLSGDREARSSGDDGSEDDEDMDVLVKELDEDIPLTKTGYSVPPAYPPIQVHSAPKVNAPDSTGFTEVSADTSSSLRPREEELKQEHSEGTSPSSYSSPTQPKLAFGLKKTSTPSQSQPSNIQMQAKSKLDNVFTTEEDEQERKPKKKLVPIDYSDEDEEETAPEQSPESGRRRSHRSSRKRRSSNNSIGMVMRGSSLSMGEDVAEDGREKKFSTDDRKKMVQTLVNNIPTAKEEVFRYQLKWDQIDKGLIEKRIGPWINKKITEYIGESEPILTEFICNKLSCHIAPNDILNDIAMVLDDEAEVFIVKLWRLLIYETEAKHLGIQKKNY